MSFNISDFFTSGASTLVETVGTAIDKLVTSDEEKLVLKNKLQEAMNEYNLEIEQKWVQHEQEITKRWQSDNEHLLTRLVRPLSFAWVVILFSVVVIGDNAWGINVKDAYIPVLETLLTTMTVAYFGARTFDKHSKNKHKG